VLTISKKYNIMLRSVMIAYPYESWALIWRTFCWRMTLQHQLLRIHVIKSS